MVSLNIDFNDFNRLFNSALVAAGFCASETPRRRAKRNGSTKTSRKRRQNKDSSSHLTAKVGFFLRQILFAAHLLTASAAEFLMQPCQMTQSSAGAS